MSCVPVAHVSSHILARVRSQSCQLISSGLGEIPRLQRPYLLDQVLLLADGPGRFNFLCERASAVICAYAFAHLCTDESVRVRMHRVRFTELQGSSHGTATDYA